MTIIFLLILYWKYSKYIPKNCIFTPTNANKNSMKVLTKHELIHSFRGGNTKRRDALYIYYQEWFDLPLTAQMLAERISEDLGIRVGQSIIYHIRSKHKPRPSSGSPLSIAQSSVPARSDLSVSSAPDPTDPRFTHSTIQFL